MLGGFPCQHRNGIAVFRARRTLIYSLNIQLLLIAPYTHNNIFQAWTQTVLELCDLLFIYFTFLEANLGCLLQ